MTNRCSNDMAMNANGDNGLYTLDSEELRAAKSKNGIENKLMFAICLKFLQLEGRYPTNNDVIGQAMISVIAIQLGCYNTEYNINKCNWESRTAERFRQEIRLLLGYKKATTVDSNKLIGWLIENILPEAPTVLQITDKAYKFLRDQRLEPFKPAQLERYIATSCYQFEQQLFANIFSQLSTATIESIDALLEEIDELEDEQQHDTSDDINNYTDTKLQDEEAKRLEKIKLIHLKKSIAGAKLKNVDAELDKIKLLRMLKLPLSLNSLARRVKQKYYTRIFASIPSNIKEYNQKALYASMAIFCHFRSELLTDDLVETLLQLIHKIRTSAEVSINKQILSEVKCVNGKFDILYKLAETAVEHPTGIIQDTIYPKVSKEKLECLTKELMSNKNAWYEQQVQRKMVSSYSHSHRRVLLKLLDIFSFDTNNEYKPILQAIQFIIRNKEVRDKYYEDAKEVPALDLIESKWRSQVVENNNGGAKHETKIHRINYEIAILEKLHSLLVCKLIWIDGAYRFRNPAEDLPKDFNLRPEYYYQLLNLPTDPKAYIQRLKDDLNQNLQQLNDNILDNKKVKIVPSAKDSKVGKIKITPYDAQVASNHLAPLQQAINNRWPTINLIDILKETDFRIGFTKYFPTVASRENINKTKLLKRLLLCIYAIGSNTGLKRISAANEDVSHAELRYIKRKFINVVNVRQAIAHVINAILEIRDPSIWGTATTGCACDSTKVSSWDQNLMTQWHTRYRGRGVMIYWHVDKNSALIYSQLKTCSSSEVGSMIKGVLDHCSKMDMKEAYVDTHGQSTIGFGFSNLLSFDLLPRLRKIKNQKLYYPEAKDKRRFKNLEAILKSPINWRTIEKHYHEAVKHAVALKIGTVEPDVMIKHLNKDNNNHPAYQALSEIGKVEKTIFLCRYLMSEELRIEIHEALNIVERMNSIMGFIFYGKLGEISTNDRDEQELAIVCLHLLQVCMVYINTLMIQEVLSDSSWRKILLTAEGKKILTPLIHAHINPYGLFPLDLNTRVIIEEHKEILRVQV